MDAIVFGNTTLDTLCYPVDDVPRRASLGFDRSFVGPGGCGSNVAIGLCALGLRAALVGRIGGDEAGALVARTWERVGLDTRFVCRMADAPTAVSVGLVDSDAQPRFIHTPGANAHLTADDLDAALPILAAEGARALHVGGFLVLPGVSGTRLAGALAAAREHGLFTTLDVAISSHSEGPEAVWPSLPHLGALLCNAREAQYLSGEAHSAAAARALLARGARAVVVKLGAGGCRAYSDEETMSVPAPQVARVVDTTGAGDAFAAGFIAARLQGAGLEAACRAGNEAGARMVGLLGACAAWLRPPGESLGDAE